MNKELVLENLMPYRLAVLSKTISSAAAMTYDRRFGLSVPQWHVMAVLARFPGLSAVEVVEHTQLDKVAVSRAVAKLVKSGHINRGCAAADRRRSILDLSKKGHRIHDEIATLALQFETNLLKGLSKAEINELSAVMDQLMARARQLGRDAL